MPAFAEGDQLETGEAGELEGGGPISGLEE